METHVTGQPVLGELRQALCAVLFGNPLLLPPEQLLANHRIHECEDAAQLARWCTNVLAEIARRAAVARLCGQATLHATLHRLRSAGLRYLRPRKSILPAWVPGTPLPDQADRRAGTFDRWAAARFQPGDSLRYVHLSTSQPQ